jgi:hypothetical protein
MMPPEPDNTAAEPPEALETAAPAPEPPGDVGCMLFLGFLLLLPPLVFLYAPVVLALLVALFFAWLISLGLRKALFKKASPWKVLLWCWGLTILVMVAGAFVLGFYKP